MARELEDMTRPELAEVAKRHGVHVSAHWPKAKMLEAMSVIRAGADEPRTDPAISDMSRSEVQRRCADAMDERMEAEGLDKVGGKFTSGGAVIDAQYRTRGGGHVLAVMRWAAGAEPRPAREADKPGARRAALYWLARHPEEREATVELVTVRMYSTDVFRVERTELGTAAVA